MPCKTARGPLSSVTPDRITTLSEFVYRLSEDPGILRTYDACYTTRYSTHQTT